MSYDIVVHFYLFSVFTFLPNIAAMGFSVRATGFLTRSSGLHTAFTMFQTETKRFHFLLLLFILHSEAEQAYAVWPMPQQMSQSTERYPVNPQLFAFSYARDSAAQSGCSVLDAAFERYSFH